MTFTTEQRARLERYAAGVLFDKSGDIAGYTGAEPVRHTDLRAILAHADELAAALEALHDATYFADAPDEVVRARILLATHPRKA